MDYGIPVRPAWHVGSTLIVCGIYTNTYIVLILGVILLAVTLFSHMNLRRNEK